jgi:hypothetical protein
VLGTSALEVGVDFRTTRLFFEALSAASFAQRLGRVGRHAEGEATYLTDARVTAALASLGDGRVHTRDELFAAASAAIPDERDLAGFVSSAFGRAVADAIFDALTDWGHSRKVPDPFFLEVETARSALLTQLGIAAAPAPTVVPRAVRSRLSSAIGFRGGSGSVEVFDVRERDRRGSDELAVYEVELPLFYRRAQWQGEARPGARPLIVGFGKPRKLGLTLSLVSASADGLHAPASDQIELRVDGAATSWEMLLRENEHIVGLFPSSLRARLSWREDVFDSDDGRIALLDDDALVAAFHWERARTPR